MREIYILLIIWYLIASQGAVADPYHEYLAKLKSPVKTGEEFSKKDLSESPEIQGWVKSVDRSLDTEKLGVYDAIFSLKFDQDGYINALSIKTLNEYKFDKFKDFIAKLGDYQAPKLPQSLNPNTVFELDARFLYLERKVDDNYATTLDQASSIEAKLIEPSFIDYPAVGEDLIFEINQVNLQDGKVSDTLQGAFIQTKVSDIDRKKITILLDKIIYQDSTIIKNLSFNVERPKVSSRAALSTALTAGLVAASQAGITGSVLSNGILPGALAVTGIGSSVVEERVILRPFNFARGDRVKLKVEV